MQTSLPNAPDMLVGWRISVLWADDGEWYLGQVMSFDTKSGQHSILYDDQTQEDVDLAVRV